VEAVVQEEEDLVVQQLGLLAVEVLEVLSLVLLQPRPELLILLQLE
jgi:hypothetical protein